MPDSDKKINTTGVSVKKNLIDNNNDYKNPLFKPSEEFRVFWGNHLDPIWFKSKSIFSPFLFVLIFFTLLIFYFCGSLLFSSEELINLFQKDIESITQPEEETETTTTEENTNNTEQEAVSE